MYKKLFLCYIAFACILLVGCTSDSVNNNKVSTEKLVDTLSNGESFQFRGIEWFANEDEVLRHENIDKEDSVESSLDRIVHRQPITFEEVGLTVDSIIYNFHKEPNMFVSGQYVATFDDKEKYLETVEKVKNALNSQFDGFRKTEQDNFDPTTNDSLIWWSEQDSMLTFSVFVNNDESESNSPYIIQIHASATPQS